MKDNTVYTKIKKIKKNIHGACMKEIITTIVLDRYKINVRAVQIFFCLFKKRFYMYECYVCTCLVLTEVRNVTYYGTELCMVLKHLFWEVIPGTATSVLNH